MPPYDLVIFDCDGVLVDSERITNRVFAELLNELGVPATLESMFARYLGNSWPRCLELVAEDLGGAPPAEFEAKFRARLGEALAREVTPVRGVVAVLDALDAAGVPYCVASNGDHGKMAATLGPTGLAPRFEGRRFSAVDVARGKPAPDVYLLAAERMGAVPARCAVVEDTPVGVAAGVAAGMTVHGYAELFPADRLRAAGAAHTVAEMAELPALLTGA
jgi:HAD superfamily hydrolase (TIGR01509 family)